MPNPRASRLSPTGLAAEPPAPRVPPARRRLLAGLGALLALALVMLAWFDGGEEPLRPIAEPVVLPEAAR